MKKINKGDFWSNFKEKLTGDRKIIESNLSSIYTGNRLKEEIDKYKRNMMQKYLLIWVVCIVIVIIFLINGILQHKTLTHIERPQKGEGSITVPVNINAKYGDAEVENNVDLYISERHLTNKEIKKAVENCAKEISNIVPKDSFGNRVVFQDIELPTIDEKSGAAIKWTSSDPVIISEDGKVDVLALSKDSEKLTLTAEISLGNKEHKEDIHVIVVKDPAMYKSSITNSINQMLKEIDVDGGWDKVILPKTLNNGVKLKWNTPKDSRGLMVIVMGVVSLLSIYLRRYSNVRKKVKNYREAVIEDFPYVIDKLVLMLNSGLTVFTALMKMSDDNKSSKNESPLMAEITAIGLRVKETNALWLDEWKNFAVRMESSDMLRFISLLEDNYKKGGELVGKLETEGDTMREMRKKNVQQRIRLIDSKMTIPMMLMLMSLLIVTVTPSITQI